MDNDYLVGGFNPSEKYESQLGLLFPTEWKIIKHVPNHQPVLYQAMVFRLVGLFHSFQKQ
jgi:hypothetical protein